MSAITPSTDGPRLDRWDVLALSALLILGVLAARHLAAAIGPTVTMIGPDSATYMKNIVAVATNSYADYNGDKRQLHAILCAWVGGWTGDDYLGATRLVSIGAIGSLPALTYLMGRAAFCRSISLGGAIVVLAQPELWACTVDTSNYALFSGMIACFMAAATWAAARPGVLGWGLAGALAALCHATQEKAALVVPLAAAFALLGLARLPGWRHRLVLPLVAAVAAWGASRVVEVPVDMRSLAHLVVNVRGDVNRNAGYVWPVLHTRPRESPSPLSPYLVGPLRNRELEALFAAVLTPPDADVWRLVSHGPAAGPGAWILAPRTSIPPARVRWARMWEVVSADPGRWGIYRAGLLAFGLLTLVLWRPLGWPRSRLAGWVVASVLVSALPTLNVNYVRRYLEHVLPAVALLQVAGLGWLVAMFPFPLRVRAPLAGGLVVAVSVVWALAIATDDHDEPGKTKSVEITLAALREQQLGDGFPLAMTEAARWLEDHPAPGILDCGSIPIRLLLPGSLRITTVGPKGCRAAEDATQAPGTLLVVSDRPEYTSTPPANRASLKLDPRWESVARFSPLLRPQDEIEVFRAR